MILFDLVFLFLLFTFTCNYTKVTTYKHDSYQHDTKLLLCNWKTIVVKQFFIQCNDAPISRLYTSFTFDISQEQIHRILCYPNANSSDGFSIMIYTVLPSLSSRSQLVTLLTKLLLMDNDE